MRQLDVSVSEMKFLSLGNSFRGLVVIALILVVLVSGVTVVSLSYNYFLKTKAQAQGGSLGIMIPLYTDSGSAWNSVIQAKHSYRNVPFIVVINPNDGPGRWKNSSYVSGVKQMQSLGITVVGYIDTLYSNLSIPSAESQVNSYYYWYHVQGMVFDDMNTSFSTESYYLALVNHVHSLGMNLTIGNPGMTVPAMEIGLFNIVDIYENPGLPVLSSLFYSGFPSSDFALIAIGVSLNRTFIFDSRNYVGYIYLTDQNSSNPYLFLPSYFTNEVATISSLDDSN
jgi:hypothetical protein